VNPAEVAAKGGTATDWVPMQKTSVPRRGLVILGVLTTLAVPIVTLGRYRDDTVYAVAYYVVFCLCQALLVLAVRRVPAALRGPWKLMIVTGAMWAAGETYALYATIRGIEAYPTPADIAYGLGYAFLAITVLRLDRENGKALKAGAVLDAIIVTVSVGVLAVVFLILPLLTDSSQSIAARVVSSMYPLADVMMVYLVVRLLGSSRGNVRRPAVLWLSVAMLSTLAADTGLNLWTLLDGDDQYPRVLDCLWLMFYLFVAYAAIAAGRPARPERRRTARGGIRTGLDLTIPRLVLLAVAAMLPSVVIVLRSRLADDPGYAELGLGSALLITLVIIRIWGLIKQLRRQAVRLDLLATTDPLTEVANRRSWDAELGRRLSPDRAGSDVVLVALLDLDHFKRFNDSRGHHAGDDLLRRAAEAWRSALGADGLIARWGGEEFAVVLRADDERSGLAVLDGLRHVVPERQTVSIGVARWDGELGPELLMRRADAALYEAKAAGRNGLCVAGSAPEGPAKSGRRPGPAAQVIGEQRVGAA
jgi:diguanylate cyclase (GGDEF)-like protein